MVRVLSVNSDKCLFSETESAVSVSCLWLDLFVFYSELHLCVGELLERLRAGVRGI